MQVELGMSDTSVVSNRNLGDRDALQGAFREQVRLQVEPGGGQAKGFEPIGSEAPHPAADVGDRGREQERSEPAQDMVPGSIRQGHRTVVDLTPEARSEDDGTSGTELLDEIGDDLRRIGAVAVQQDGKLVADPRDELPERGSLAATALDADLRPE